MTIEISKNIVCPKCGNILIAISGGAKFVVPKKMILTCRKCESQENLLPYSGKQADSE